MLEVGRLAIIPHWATISFTPFPMGSTVVALLLAIRPAKVAWKIPRIVVDAI
jgi:hypothetical protein